MVTVTDVADVELDWADTEAVAARASEQLTIVQSVNKLFIISSRYCNGRN
jgi:hypothetical protein